MNSDFRQAVNPGRFITFEGIDGAGKSSHIQSFATMLRAAGHSVVLTREPGGSPLAESIRTLLLTAEMSAITELLLAFAARADHLEQTIRPALSRGEWVICDRFTDSTYAYQGGGRGLGAEPVALLERWVHGDLQPDLTVLFELSPEEAAHRRGQARPADRIEREAIEFFRRVDQAYRARADAMPGRFLRIDASQSIESISKQLEEYASKWLK